MKLDARTQGDPLSFDVDGRPQGANRTWFRGEHCHFNPAVDNLLTAGSIVRHITAGWTPPQPTIQSSTRITAFGSCFAEHISTWLSERDYAVLSKDASSNAHIVRMGEGMVNTFALAEQFTWALEGHRSEGDLWHGYDAEAFGYGEDVRMETRGILMETDVFIITFGLSEIWYDEKTGGVFWRAVPAASFNPTRHKFRVASFGENKANLRVIYDLIRRHRPEAKIIFTMSPIPLVATFRPVSAITANSASKALLRGAIDEFYREVEGEGALHYWPSYEMILDVFDRRWADDRRHVKKAVLAFVMTLFEHLWCVGGPDLRKLSLTYAHALAVTGLIPLKAPLVLERGDSKEIAEFARRLDEKAASAQQAKQFHALAIECAGAT